MPNIIELMDMREKIITESGKLFVQNGIRQVTMDTIAQTMGISKRTIYENFKDKDDLLEHFLTVSIKEHKKGSLKIIEEAGNVIEALFRIGEDNYKKMKSINPVFFQDIKKYHSGIFKKIVQNGRMKDYETTKTVLTRGINEGLFLKEINVEVANLYIHYSADFTPIAEEKLKCGHVDILRSVHLPYLRGISTEKGREIIDTFISKKNSKKQNT